MKRIEPHDRPREKLERMGAGSLGDNELIALVLGHGAAKSGALDLANDVLTAVGGLHGLARASADELRCVSGIGAARASQLLAAVEAGRRTLVRGRRERPQIIEPRNVADLLIPQFGSKRVEHFGVLLLDTKHRVMRTSVVSIGSLDASVVHPREVFREATTVGAAAIVLFHNHPSGDPAPSRDDVALTERLVRAGELMGIHVLDHVIVAENRFYSMRERKDL
ncbi:MAG TPA: DNA repair protein RadC [Vicinamibacterales bacterium]|jgi:DNA repair protein RadC|nr:DNA repair protein RadC [Vicinamibacterales bacterium]